MYKWCIKLILWLIYTKRKPLKTKSSLWAVDIAPNQSNTTETYSLPDHNSLFHALGSHRSIFFELIDPIHTQNPMLS